MYEGEGIDAEVKSDTLHTAYLASCSTWVLIVILLEIPINQLLYIKGISLEFSHKKGASYTANWWIQGYQRGVSHETGRTFPAFSLRWPLEAGDGFTKWKKTDE